MIHAEIFARILSLGIAYYVCVCVSDARCVHELVRVTMHDLYYVTYTLIVKICMCRKEIAIRVAAQ